MGENTERCQMTAPSPQYLLACNQAHIPNQSLTERREKEGKMKWKEDKEGKRMQGRQKRRHEDTSSEHEGSV